MLVGRVIDHQLGDHPDAAAMGLLDEAIKIVECSVTRVNVLVVRDVVAVVSERRRIEGKQPEAVDPEALEIWKLLREPAEITDAIVVAVEERTNVDLVDDRVLVPERVLLLAGKHQRFGSDDSSPSGAGNS